jgi:hypothetical protein
MKLIEKKIALWELLQIKNIYYKLYTGITDIDRVIEIDENVIDRIEKITEKYNLALEKLKRDVSEGAVSEDQFTQKHIEILNQTVTFNMATISKDDIKNIHLNILEYRAVKEFIE